MNLFFINILLAMGFMVALESYSLGTLTAGLLTGYAALWLTQPLYSDNRYFKRVPNAIGLVFFLSKPFSSPICGCYGTW